MLAVTINSDNFEAFIDYMYTKCDKVSFHIPNCSSNKLDYIKYEQQCKELLNRMEPFVIEKRISKQYGSSAYGYNTGIYIVELCEEVITILKESGSVSRWQYPEYPEDLCFFEKGKTTCWYTSVGHEENCEFLYNETTEDIEFLEKNDIEYQDVSFLCGEVPDYKKWGKQEKYSKNKLIHLTACMLMLGMGIGMLIKIRKKYFS